MAELRYPSQTRAGSQVAVDQGLRSYMLGIYNYMALGVAVTAVIVMATFTIPALGAIANVLAFPAMLGLIGMGFFAQLRGQRAAVDAGQFECPDPRASAWRLLALLDGLTIQVVAQTDGPGRADVEAWSHHMARVETGRA